MMSIMNEKEYAKVSWRIGDIQELKPDWSERQCYEFLINNQRHIQDAMITRGWDALDTLLSMEED
jgi:hypothetical protein